MNLLPVIISALVQFCLGLGWYDGYRYHTFSNKNLRRHKPRTHFSSFPLWKKQHFWRKRRIPEDEHQYKSNEKLPLNTLHAGKRFLQYSPYFPSYFTRARSKVNKPKHHFNDFNVYRKNINNNAFVRRNFMRPPYYPFYFKSPSMYLSHYRGLHDFLADHMHSGTSEIEKPIVNIALNKYEKNTSRRNFGKLRDNLDAVNVLPENDQFKTYSQTNSLIPESKARYPQLNNYIEPDTLATLHLEDQSLLSDPTVGTMNKGSANVMTDIKPDENSVSLFDAENENSFGTILNLESEIFQDKSVLLDQTLKNNKGTLSENSFGGIMHFPFVSNKFNSNVERGKLQYKSNNLGFTNYENLHLERPVHKDNELSMKGVFNNTGSWTDFGTNKNQVGLQTKLNLDQRLSNPDTIRLYNRPLESANPASRSSDFVEGFTNKDENRIEGFLDDRVVHEFSDRGNVKGFASNEQIDGFANNVGMDGFNDNTNFYDIDGGGTFVETAEEGTFNSNKNGCEGITRRRCVSDSECSCYGSFFCIEGLCSMMKASSHDDGNDGDQIWHR